MERSSTTYVHGTAREEQTRLSRLNDLINERSLAALSLQGGERVLDLGSGLGQLARGMARAVGSNGRVVGIERSEEQRAEALRLARESGEDGLPDIRSGDAVEPPLAEDEWGSFDVAHARFLLEHVPDPLAVVRVMVRAARPGGRIVLEDDDHDLLRLWPEPPSFEPIWRAYIRTYDRLGSDPFVGRRLVSLLAEAGAEPVRNTWIFFGSCAGHPQFEAYVENCATILEGARSHILETGHLDPQLFTEGIAALRDFGRRPDGAFWYATAWAEGRRNDR